MSWRRRGSALLFSAAETASSVPLASASRARRAALRTGRDAGGPRARRRRPGRLPLVSLGPAELPRGPSRLRLLFPAVSVPRLPEVFRHVRRDVDNGVRKSEGCRGDSLSPWRGEHGFGGPRPRAPRPRLHLPHGRERTLRRNHRPRHPSAFPAVILVPRSPSQAQPALGCPLA